MLFVQKKELDKIRKTYIYKKLPVTAVFIVIDLLFDSYIEGLIDQDFGSILRVPQ